MQGKTCLITGATAGIGLKTAEGLAAKGARLAIAARDPAKAARVAESLRQKGAAGVEVLHADLSRQSDVRALAAEVLERLPRIDVLINNSGAYVHRRDESADGIEMTWALNHLAPFLLTNLLLGRLRESGARIVTVASAAHSGAALDFGDLQLKTGYSGWKAYGRSKLANIMFTYELARRLSGSGVTANALHPGFVASSLGDNNSPLIRLGFGFAKLFAISEQKGAGTSIHLASSPEVADTTGRYFVQCQPRYSSRVSQVEESWTRLWDASAALVGLDAEGA